MVAAVASINDLLTDGGDPHLTMEALLRPEAQLPEVLPDYPSLYHDQLLELKKLKQEQAGDGAVRPSHFALFL